MKITDQTKEFSIALIAHAIARVKHQGGSEKDIADHLGVDPSNISKYKSGQSKLSPTAQSILLKLYGSPKMDTGIYFRARLYSCIDDFIDAGPEDRIQKAYLLALNKFYNNKKVLAYLAELVSTRVLEDEGDAFSSHFNSQVTPTKKIPSVLFWLKQKVNSEEFLSWYISFKERASNHFHKSSNCNIESNSWHKNSSIQSEDYPLFYLLGEYVLKYNPEFSFEFNPTEPVVDDELIEVVITGEAILEFASTSPVVKTPRSLEIFSKAYPHQSLPDSDYDLANFTKNEATLNECFLELIKFKLEAVKVVFFLNKKMEYRIVISENWLTHQQVYVINNVRADLVIEHYHTIASHYQIDTNLEPDLKSVIAKKGGFIPGALVL